MAEVPENGRKKSSARRGLRSRQFQRRAQLSQKNDGKKVEEPGKVQAQPAPQNQSRGPRSKPLVQQFEEPRKALPVLNCAICGKPIFDLLGALADKDSGEPVHFDCALERVSSSETLAPQERIAYLGAGCFGIIAPSPTKSGEIVVKKVIHWEKEGEKQSWRKDLSINVLKL